MKPADREAEGRELLWRAFNDLFPNIDQNPWIPHFPTPPQAIFLGLHQTQDRNAHEVFEALYGGAAGGGKSDSLLMACAQYANDPEFAAVVFRRTHTELAEPGAIMDRALSWWIPRGAHWDGSNKIMRFPSGAKVSFAYLAAPNDHLRYQGAEYQLSCWDELTQWPTSAAYEYVGLSRLRRREGSTIPLRTLSASNPGGPGHRWVQERFIGEMDHDGNITKPAAHRYVPARIDDNPHIDRAAYIRGLLHLHPTVRAQLLDGDWRARDPGDYFRSEWFGPLLDPEKDRWPASECVRIRWWDLAASEKPDAAFTAGVLMARSVHGVRAVEHCRSFRATPGKRDDWIVQQAKLDGHGVIVGIEIEGGSGGLAQYLALEKRLRAAGHRVVGAKPKAELTDAEGRVLVKGSIGLNPKMARADPVASCLERGHQRRGECPDTGAAWWGEDRHKAPISQRDGIRLYAGPWTQGYLDVLEGFPDGPTCDEVDAMSGAWAWLEVHAIGRQKPPQVPEKEPEYRGHDVHPEEREDGIEVGRDRAGRWKP